MGVVASLLVAAPAAAAPAVLVTDHTSGLLSINPNTGARGVLVDGDLESGFNAVTIAPDGSILLADAQLHLLPDGSIWRINPSTGARSLITSNDSPASGPAFVEPSGIAVAADGGVIVADPMAETAAATPGALIHVDPATGARTSLADNVSHAPDEPLTRPEDVAVAPSGTIYVVQDGEGKGDVFSLGANGVLAPVAHLPHDPQHFASGKPRGITAAPDGRLLVTEGDLFDNGGGSVVAVDPGNGSATTISDNTNPGPPLTLPQGIALDPSGAILVTDLSAPDGKSAVFRIDPATGARTTLSANGAPPTAFSAELFFSPGIAYAPKAPATSECKAAKKQAKKAKAKLKKAKKALKAAGTAKAKKQAKAAVKKAKKKAKKAKKAAKAAC